MHSFPGSWHWGPEGFLLGMGRGWRNRSGFSVKGTTYAKVQGWEIFRTVSGIREPSSMTQVCGAGTEV